MNTRSSPGRPILLRGASVALFAPALLAAPANAAGTRAGSLINNTATATFDNGGQTATVTSNTVTLTVDEVIDVGVASRDAGDATVAAGSTGNVRSFSVTNAGNGPEAFTLTALGHVDGNQFDPTVTALVLDTNGNGQYDPGADQVVADGFTTSPLDPDASLTVFVVSTAPAGAADAQTGRLRLRAAAATGTGPAGTVFAGQGVGGGDALAGASTAAQAATGGFTVQRASVRFEKSATVLDPFGGSRALPGSVITYRLAATVDGGGSLPNLRVHDAIPTGTTYVPDSLVQDGRALTDAADGDAGTGSSVGVDVALGTVPAGASRVTEFRVKID